MTSPIQSAHPRAATHLEALFWLKTWTAYDCMQGFNPARMKAGSVWKLLTLSMWKMRSSSQTFSKHLSNVSTNTCNRFGQSNISFLHSAGQTFHIRVRHLPSCEACQFSCWICEIVNELNFMRRCLSEDDSGLKLQEAGSCSKSYFNSFEIPGRARSAEGLERDSQPTVLLWVLFKVSHFSFRVVLKTACRPNGVAVAVQAAARRCQLDHTPADASGCLQAWKRGAAPAAGLVLSSSHQRQTGSHLLWIFASIKKTEQLESKYLGSNQRRLGLKRDSRTVTGSCWSDAD